MKHGALSILHTLLALINFCFNQQDNHKQTMHDMYNLISIKLVVINCINLSLC